MLKQIILIVSYLFLVNCTSSSKKITQSSVYDSFGVVYSDINPQQVEGYKLLIVEPYFYSREDIFHFHSKGIKVLAYLSLGEVNESRRYFNEFKSIGFKGKNEDHGSYFIDLSNKKIKDKFLKQIVPELLSFGYDGLFLDTIDAVAPYTTRKEMEPAMVELIRSIKLANPGKILIQNAGLFLLDKTSDYVNAIAVEDVASGYDFQSDQYSIKSTKEFEEKLDTIDELYYRYGIPFLIIDFAETEQDFVKVTSRLQTTNHPYFISNIEFKGLPKKTTKIKKGA